MPGWGGSSRIRVAWRSVTVEPCASCPCTHRFPERASSVDDVQLAMDEADFDRAFDRLPVDQRALLVAHHLDGRPIDDLAIDSAFQ